MIAIAKRDYELSNGEIISVGVNFKALELMSHYPGGLKKLRKTMQLSAMLDDEQDEATDDAAQMAVSALGYMLYCLIRAGGTVCTQDEVLMAIGPQDFEQLSTIFEEFSAAMASANQKKTMRESLVRSIL